MSDFDVKIVAVDSAMDAIERYQRECSDLRAHISFDMRSLFQKMDRAVLQARREIEDIESQMDVLRVSVSECASEEGSDPSENRELEELREKLWQKLSQLDDIEKLAAYCVTYGNDLLDRLVSVSSAGSAQADDAVRFMGRYIHDLNLVCNRETLNCGAYRAAEGYYVCVVDSLLYPSTAEHIRAAQNMGHPARLTIDRTGAAQRRDESLQGMPIRDGFDRDEYPMALFSEGGSGADVAHLEGSDNRGAGSYIGWQLRGIPDGAEVRIRVI